MPAAGDVMGEAAQVKEGAAGTAQGDASGGAMQVAGGHGASASNALEVPNGFLHPPDNPEEAGPYVPIEFRNDQERKRLKSQPLGMHISSDEQTAMWLNYFKPNTLSGPKLSCMGLPCPQFLQCIDGFPNVWACWDDELMDREMFPTHAPLNCPIRAAGEEKLVGGRKGTSHHPFNSVACSSSFISPPWSTRSPLTIPPTRQPLPRHQPPHPFNRSTLYPTTQYTFSPAAAVHELHGAWSRAYAVGGNFYHVLVEMLPGFVVAASLFHKYRKYPILATGDIMGEAGQVKEEAAAAAEGAASGAAMEVVGESGTLPEAANVILHGPDNPEEVGPHVPTEFRNDEERVKLKSRPLGMRISSDEQTAVWLNYFHLNTQSGPKLSCMGNPCPHLYKCNDGYPNVLACWNSELVDHEMFLTSAPLNCPNRAAGAERVAGEEGEYDEWCSHKADHGLRMPWALQNFQLSDVYITHDGFLFNATHQFVRGGCHKIGK
ncbi:unnamed protein product [Closterium sp. Naga37s-1]|nr:unnamed protein product [Closterium sp. Naga37s-1]